MLCVEDFDIKRKISHFLSLSFFPPLSLLALPRDVRSLLECLLPGGRRISREKETCFFCFSFQKSNDPPVTFYSCGETLNARGEPEIFSSSALTQLEYWKLAFFFFIISSPLVSAISPSEKAVAIGSFFLSNTERLIYLFFLLSSSMEMV